MSSLLNSAAETCSSGPGGSSYDGWTVTGVTVSLRRVGARRSFDRSLEGHPYSTYIASVANRLSTALPRVHFWSGFSGMAIKASVAPLLDANASFYTLQTFRVVMACGIVAPTGELARVRLELWVNIPP